MKTLSCLSGLLLFCIASWALPAFDPFSNTVGTIPNGTAYAPTTPLYHQTNAFGEGWALWNGGNGSSTAAVQCVSSNLSYAGFPSAFPPVSPTNAVLLPGNAQGVNVFGYNAALSFSRVISADPNNLVTNKIYASFLLTVPVIGKLTSGVGNPIFFGGFNNSTIGDQSTGAPPGKSFKFFLEGNSTTVGASTNWAIGIGDNNGGASDRFDPVFRAPNTVLFVVVDYEFGINGNNDNAKIWVNPLPGDFGSPVAPTPTTNITITAASGNQLGQAASLFLLTRTGVAIWGSVVLGNLRVGTTWAFVTGGPEFTNQPVSQTAIVGSTVTFNSAAVAGGSSVSYQWQRNGSNIAGATQPSFTITNVATTDSASYAVAVSNAVATIISTNAILNVGLPTPPVVTTPPHSRVQRVGDDLAFAVLATGATAFQWQFNGQTISAATNSTLALTNIQLTNAGTYTVIASNAGGSVTNSATLGVSAGLVHLSPANLIVARVGDGAQPLSSGAGNTIYLDQYTADGTYISTIMVPNAGAPSLIVPGTGDGIYQADLNLSVNDQFVNFGGYNVSYPFNGGDVTSGTIRGIAAVNGLGYYTLVLTNIGLYSAGGHSFRSVVSTDGLINFWTAGAASSAGIKYIAPGIAPNGTGIPAIGGGNPGTRSVGIFAGSLAFTDCETNLTQTGINTFDGLPFQTASSSLMVQTGTSSHPNDFAISPDGNTIYIADDSATGNFGIQRWDFDQVQWSLSYTLGTATPSFVGARGLTVDFSQFSGDGADATGAILYATTAEPNGNRLISIDDEGIGSAATELDTAGPNQMFRGICFGPVAAEVYAATPPLDRTNDLGTTASFSVAVSGSMPISYQWQFNGTNISGATLSSLSISNTTITNAGTYTVLFANDISTNSASASLTIPVDTNAPTIVAAQSLGFTSVALTMSVPITAQTATNTTNYTLTGPGGSVSIFSASQNASASNIVLTVGTLTNGLTYTLTVSNLANAFAPDNVIAAGASVSFVASPYVPIGIGTPQPIQTVLSNGVTLSTTGLLLNGTNDQSGFSGQLQYGDFDISVHVAGLTAADVWTEAGLMARQTLAPGSTFAGSIATPTMSGCFFDYRSSSNGITTPSGGFPANIPNTWLRLSRAGSLFTGYASYDGAIWTRLGSATIAMTDPIYVGLVATSNDTNAPTTVSFLDPGPTSTNAIVGTDLNPHEPLGPCSRKTGIVISEIMYKPAPRTDTNNCEFIELYNSQPFFHDISGYQITCADMNYTFPSNTIIPAGGFLVVAASPDSIKNIYGISNVFGPYQGSLKKSETLQLLDEQGHVLLTVPYSATYPWPVAAAGTGHSIILANPSYGEEDPRAWDISDAIGGSPGALDSYRPSPLRNVVINEFLAHSENPAIPQFIELYNHSTNIVDLSGCVLTDDPSTNLFTIPAGTTIGPRSFISFDQTQLGFSLDGAGDTIYFIKPDATRVLDAVQFEPQSDGISFGRSPDGANDFYPFVSTTPGTNNSQTAIAPVVINELMYDPISGNDDDQYIELYNTSSNSLSLADWRVTAGVTFTFPPGAAISSNGYVVIARNLTNLLARYTNLNTGNTFGNYSGKLSHNGERVALARPEVFSGTATNYVTEDEVTYGTGGQWGQWSAGGGSSLELINPHANHRLAANWADSDETHKSQWVTISNTGILDNGSNYTSGISYAQVGLLDTGECLMDNVQVLFNGTNYITNSTFETGIAGWNSFGCHVRSSLEPEGYQSANSLHIRCSDKFWHAENSCEIQLPSNPMAAGNTVTLQFQARWLHGSAEPILHLCGNWLEAYGLLPVPTNLGTPGMPNSVRVPNAAPAIHDVTHTPSLPAANQPVVVTARVDDPDIVANVTLYYRLDPSQSYNPIPMVDNGTAGDAIAGDGVFSATIPGQAANVIAAFYITASDSLGATNRFPALRPSNNEPARECLIMFGDGTPVSSMGTYHLWITQTNIQRWIKDADLGNEYIDGTFVNNNRVIYNMGGRFATSPAHQNFDSPVGKYCSYAWQMPDDDKFLGATSFQKIHLPGNGGFNDNTLQREATSYTFLRALGEPWLYRRDVAVYVNGNRRGALMEDVQLPNGDVVKENFPNDTDGYLYKFDQWYEFAALPSGTSISYAKYRTHTLMPYTTTGGVKKATVYRPMYELRRTPTSMNDFTNIFSLVDAASSYGTPGYVANMENLANMRNWMDVFAVNHAVGNWDVYSGTTGHNLYGYIGALGTKMTLLMWDMNIDLGLGWGAGQNLFNINPADPNTENIFNCPTFRRMYWQAFQRLINGPFSAAGAAPLANAKYKAFIDLNLGNYLSLADPNTAMLPWIEQARASIGSQLAAADVAQFSVNSTVSITNNIAYITGAAPIAVDTILINGVAWPVTWTTTTGWRITVPLQPGTNVLTVTGVDIHGQPVPGATGTISPFSPQPAGSASGNVVINEIMSNPAVPNAAYVELYNNSSTTAFDLSGWQLKGVGYTFPPGSMIAPNSFLVLAAEASAFANAYGATVPIFDTFPGSLTSAETLTLFDASSNIITRVHYDTALPWPAGTNPGVALELIDPNQDNWRVGNWKAVSHTPATTNSVFATLPAFAPLWINEVLPDNRTSITNSAGLRVPWLELYNPTTNSVSLDGLFLSPDYSNLTNWAFPSGTTINAGQFLVIFADGQTILTTANELHAGFTIPASAGSIALTRVYNGQPQVLDYIDYTNLPSNNSFGSLPDAQSFDRQQFFRTTPGAPNDSTPLDVVSYPSARWLYTQDFDSLPDPGATTVNADNPITINGVTYSPANPLNFAQSIANGGLGLATTMAGWHSSAAVAMKLGASAGDQSTGGIISFGSANGATNNRALGLLATSSTGATAFGLALLNASSNVLNEISLNFTGELWRQQPAAKFLSFSYYIDPTGTNGFSTNNTQPLHALDVNFPTGSFSPVDGTQSQNQTFRGVTNQLIADWPPAATLWLVWQMTNNSGNAQGLAIDNLSFAADTTYVPPSITAQPQSLTVNSGNNPQFSVTATSAFPLSYQWRKDGGNISGATQSVLSLNDVGANDQGSYDVIVTNQYGATTSDVATLTVNLVTGLPIINPQPVSQTNSLGSTVTFFISASGSPPLSYQWQLNGSDISGATNTSLVIPNISSANVGSYLVLVTDADGTTNSDTAYLALLTIPPSITSQPVSRTVALGTTATFSAAADGSAPLVYHWMRNSTPLNDDTFYSGTTTSNLTINNVQSARTGTYTLVVTNTGGSAISDPAVLSLVAPSYVAYTNAGGIYTQTFDTMPNPGVTTVNTGNPVTINGTNYTLANPVDFAYPVLASTNGGIGLNTSMPGWYGFASIGLKLGASDGDQTTGGIVSFGPTNSAATNRSLGLLATSTSGATAFAVRILNQTPVTLTNMNLSFTGELWRQQTTAKSLAFSYYVDPTGAATFATTNVTATLPALNVSFATGSSAFGGSGPLLTTQYSVTNQPITNCPPGAALWLTWQMTSAAGSAQGLGIDNFNFSANGASPPTPTLTISQSSATNITLTWPSNFVGYALQYTLSDSFSSNSWQTVPATITNNTVTLPVTNQIQYFRLKQ